MKYLLFDADQTLWDFKKTEEIALSILFNYFNIPNNEEMVEKYMSGNSLCWKEYEEGKLSLKELETKRWELFFSKTGLSYSAKEAAELFGKSIAENGILLEGAEDFLSSIRDLPKALVTNGIARIQRRRLKDTKIEKYFDHIFISDEIGYHKPQKELFLYILQKIEKKSKDCIMIGDSEKSDIEGAISVNMESIYFSLCGKKSAKATYCVSNYKELEELIRRI